ncbi:PREDICTED: gamma-glutamyltransferase 6 [Nanorana parkeri]|uniref:gamma-glutamyltransferase 6 n=1 Tax=Nanorana parkeri TaxID=125878 RepID=UPI0008542527|nr:PREDICTED: gamma-glutamyltransferase 6 [Nanorana parkeri]
MDPLRPEIRYQKVEEPRGDEEEVEVTVYLHSQPSPLIREQYRETCIRIFSALLLLLVAAGFVFYDFQFRNTDASASQHRFLVHLDESPDSRVSGSPPPLTNHEELGESHHHHHHDAQTSDNEEEEGDDHEEEEGDDHEDGHSSPNHHHSVGTFHQAVAVTDSETCSMLARDVLKSGGSVVDAGISAVLCLVVVHPHTSSLGGAFSSIYFNRTSQNSSILNAIPKEASSVSYGVPQVLQGLWVLRQKYGKKPWAELVHSAVILADEGFLVDSILHAALVANHNKVLSSEGLRSLFCDSRQSLKNVGERVYNPTLGKLLEQIASSMSDSGLPEDLIHSLMTDIGVTEMEKFTESVSGHLTIEEPLTLHLDTMTLFTTGGPTAGKILSDSVQKIYNEKPQQESVSELLLNSSRMMYAHGGAWPRELSYDSSPLQLPPWNPTPVGSNVMIADSHGDIFVLSLTLNSTFGSGFVSSSTGILLSDFVQGQGSAQNSSPLYWACPSVLMYGADNDVMALSAYGGSSVPFSVAQVVVSHLLLEMDLAESVTGSLVEVPPKSSDPWMEYFGLQGNGTEPVVAVEVQAEHVHVVKFHGPCCYPAGL